MKIKVIKPQIEDLDEIDIQRAFEENLEAIQNEEGLRYVSSFVPIGTGIIDTLAVDSDKNAVIIEYKKPGDFDEAAVFQLMGYYSWFYRDENHRLYLKEVFNKVIPNFGDFEDIRLIAVTSSVSDEIRDACWALEPEVKIVNYSVSRDLEGNVTILPFVVLDTSESEGKVSVPYVEEDHLKEHENLRPLYLELKKRIMSIGADIHPNFAPRNYISFLRKRTLVFSYFRGDEIRLSVLLKPKDVGNNPRVVDKPGDENYSYVSLRSINEIDDDLMEILTLAYNKAG